MYELLRTLKGLEKVRPKEIIALNTKWNKVSDRDRSRCLRLNLNLSLINHVSKSDYAWIIFHRNIFIVHFSGWKEY